ncbi:Protein G7c [Actinoplanes sp. SE50]|uniref:protein G7c n=1 Tax=unclassified Actinoplanes TaxID=2626549 RepID=UPI00023ED460|nr:MULTISPECIES: protein G7c [unclassified Actinoplanes]AEV85004.1 Protein G7c [Actinoplanes sp. SE50/110]ATO83395.1 Protein G7c [Actinoplanes sp. SE50]SLM00802.1 protein G7c [Actinoplanes sp. SE50/110]
MRDSQRKRRWRTALCATLIGLVPAQVALPAEPAQAFAPDLSFVPSPIPLGVQTHRSITEHAVTQALGSYFGVAEPTPRMRAAIEEIVAADKAVDDDQVSSDKHFDGENFDGGQRFVLANRAALLAALTAGDGAAARGRLGTALHPIQDFYAHSNWVELGNRGPDPDLGVPGRVIGPVAGILENTCTLGGILITTKLTSGYYGGEDRVPLVLASKCRHGGPLDSGPGSGGISKDFPVSILSPHPGLHQVAAQVAEQATRKFLDEIRAAVPAWQSQLLLGADLTFGPAGASRSTRPA